MTKYTFSMKTCFLFVLFAVFSFGITTEPVLAELFNKQHSSSEKKDYISDSGGDNNKHYNTEESDDDIKDRASEQRDVVVLAHIKNMAALCLDNWEKEACLKELSSLSMDLVTAYAEALHDGAANNSMETLKQHCAASTAALKISVPAYAMQSAIAECVNTISDINAATSIKPDLSLYQLMVGSVLCLGKEASCKDIETQLSSVKQ